MNGRVQIVVGGQYGSEAKGAIAGFLAIRDNVTAAVRTGATNAGHTIVYTDAAGVKHAVAMQQLPVGWVNPTTLLVVGAGALIDLDILEREIEMVSRLTGCDVRDRLIVDPRAYIHRHEHKDRSTQSDRHHMIGATGKGCSEALMDRIRLRGLENWTVGARRDTGCLGGVRIEDTERELNHLYDHGALIQLEGTQGQLLDLYLGPYPYTTHKQTGPAQWMLEAGLSPSLKTEIVMVMRTYPIRVAGNSGPMSSEISWPILAREINAKRDIAGLAPLVDEGAIVKFENAVRAVAASGAYLIPPGSDGLDQHEWTGEAREHYRVALSEIHKRALDTLDEATVMELRKLFELTTVTKKLRRVARLSDSTLRVPARQVRPDWVAVTFMNYEFPDNHMSADGRITCTERDYLRGVAIACGAPVRMINHGPEPVHIVQLA